MRQAQTPTKHIQLYFITGRYDANNKRKSRSKTLNPNSMKRVLNNPHRDVIQVPVQEDYLNLTLKTIAMLKWSEVYCSAAQYIAKMDDDTYMNTGALFKILDRAEEFSADDVNMNITINNDNIGNNTASTDRKQRVSNDGFVLGGHGISHSVPTSGEAYHTWHINKTAYPLDVYPHYALGFFYLFSNNITPNFLKNILSMSTPVINIEDVYLTGVVRVISETPLYVVTSVYPWCVNKGVSMDEVMVMHHYSYVDERCINTRQHTDELHADETAHR